MSRAAVAAPPEVAATAPAEGAADYGGEPGAERRNFLLLIVHQVIFRVGWIFKTESIVMPYFLDTIGGGPVLRSLLMPLNRIGASLTPALYARRLKVMRQKRWSLFATTVGAGMPFAAMSVMWASGVWRTADGGVAPWTQWFFLGCYAWFFAVIGLNQLSIQIVQGKLVRKRWRGRLFTIWVLLGSPVAILAVSTLMPGWLEREDGGFSLIFAAPAVAFSIAALSLLWVRERDDSFTEPRQPGLRTLRRAAWLVVEDPKLRPIATATALYSTAFTLFPHYQALARETSGAVFDPRTLVTWTVAQNIAVAAASLLAGPVADRFGSRHAVQLAMIGASLAPLTAIGLALGAAGQAFWVVFLPLGFTPVANKMVMNYTLELVGREDQALYTSAIAICLAIPVVIGSPIVGMLVGWLGIVPVFAGGAAVMMVACSQSLRLPATEH